MTELVFRDDAYRAQVDARVTTVRSWLSPGGVAHAAFGTWTEASSASESGGPAGDRGQLRWHDAAGTAHVADIVDTRRDRTSGEILHILAAGDAAQATRSRYRATA